MDVLHEGSSPHTGTYYFSHVCSLGLSSLLVVKLIPSSLASEEFGMRTIQHEGQLPFVRLDHLAILTAPFTWREGSTQVKRWQNWSLTSGPCVLVKEARGIFGQEGSSSWLIASDDGY